MNYKIVISSFQGKLLIRNEPNDNARTIGSVSHNEKLKVESVAIESNGNSWYKIASGGYIKAENLRDEKQEEDNEKVSIAINKAMEAAVKAENAAKACEGITAGMNTIIDEVTGKACKLGMSNGIILAKEM